MGNLSRSRSIVPEQGCLGSAHDPFVWGAVKISRPASLLQAAASNSEHQYQSLSLDSSASAGRD